MSRDSYFVYKAKRHTTKFLKCLQRKRSVENKSSDMSDSDIEVNEVTNITDNYCSEQTVVNCSEKQEINKKNITIKVKSYFHIKMIKDAKIGVCKLCKTEKTIKMTNSNTTGLKRHLQKNYKKAYRTIFGNSNSPGSSKQLSIHDAFKQVCFCSITKDKE